MNALVSTLLLLSTPLVHSYFTPPPPISPATNLPNKIHQWRGQKIRYQVCGAPSSPHAVILIHGLFVNSDHWRRTFLDLSEAGYRVYALDLLGCGYSSKPPRSSPEARALNGENNRFSNGNEVLRDAVLGTANGGQRVADVDLLHPLESCYNFYTWGEQIADFAREVVRAETCTLVANSIGTISALQAASDVGFDGVFVVNPNFRELHAAEVPFSSFALPVIRGVQKVLREKGQGLFDFLAKPEYVREILKEPYERVDAIDDTLVDVLLDPLLTKGASDVVFDTLSYSAGPLPEVQLRSLTDVPVWICYGDKDPWTPAERVESLIHLQSVERVVKLKDVGHCPHDEAPELVNPLILEFLERIQTRKGTKS